MELYLAIEALSYSAEPLGRHFLLLWLPIDLILLIRKVLLRLRRHRTGLYPLQLLHTLASHEFLLLLREYFMKRFGCNTSQC